MPVALLNFLRPVYLLAALSLALTIGLYVEHARYGRAVAQLEACATRSAVAAVAIDAQNKAVKELQAKSQEQGERVRRAELRAAATAAKAEASATAYATAVIPADCQEASRWLSKEARKTGQEFAQ